MRSIKEKCRIAYKDGYNVGIIAFKTALVSVPMTEKAKADLEQTMNMFANMLMR